MTGIIARHIFLWLTEPGKEGAQDTLRRVASAELIRPEAETAALESMRKKLADARPIVTGKGTIDGKDERRTQT
jgi:hypothetical protein